MMLRPAKSCLVLAALCAALGGGGAPAWSQSHGAGQGLTLTGAVSRLPVQPEHRTGYDRDAFHHWVDSDHDGCDTRDEVLLAEAVKKPSRNERCSLEGGEWFSYYDAKTVTDSSRLDIDHMVPLAEAWDSGASAWSAGRRERYANDLNAPRSLVAVTAHTNRSKADRDVAEWLPPQAGALCRYVTDWVSVKTRWGLSVDKRELSVLRSLATGQCADARVNVRTAP